ncbi:SNF2 family domain-containing protein [Rutstroemia sp. NJR-2017a WRK4]|nr:SNF2 family domain-containing protein [Rutstroemia sp. NJR-2017a WRK4]
MAATSQQNRSASEPLVNPNLNDNLDDDIMEATEAEWIPAPRAVKKSDSVPPATSTPSITIKTEPHDIEAVNPIVVSLPLAAPATPTKKRARFGEEPSIAGNSETMDLHIKNESGIEREASPPPYSRGISTPPKRRKSLFQNTPYSYMTSTSTQQQVDNEEEAQESEYEFDLESESGSASASEWEPEIADAQPQVQKKPKKPRAKPVKTAREWWVRCYNTKAKFPKARNRRIFANDGAASKVHNFMNHDPVANHNESAKKDVTSDVVATSKQAYFDQVTRNIRTDGRIHYCRGDKTALRVAGESFGRGNVKFAKEDSWAVKGMKSSLLPHQLLCASWMLGREFDPEGPSGGFNCDVMGLGKTVEVLATIIGNPRPADVPRKEVGPTLVVCPSSISMQWRAEIGKHLADDEINVVVYRKSQKLERQAVQNADIVVTTYHQLLMSCPWPTKEWFAKLTRVRVDGGGSIDEETDIEKWIDENRKDRADVLHQIKWYRVSLSSSSNIDHMLTNNLQIVLDEAHNIKNHASRTSHAANALLGQHRWVVTGTPMMNRRTG